MKRIKLFFGLLVVGILVLLYTPFNIYADGNDDQIIVTVDPSDNPSTNVLNINRALQTEHEGKTLVVQLNPGDYHLNGSLYIYSKTVLNCGNAKLYKDNVNHADGTSYGAMLEAHLEETDGAYNGTHDISIIGGTWDSSAVLTLGGTETMRFIHCNGVSLEGITLCNVPDGSHLVVLAGTKNVHVNNCKFYGYYNWKKPSSQKEALQLDVTHSRSIVPTNQVGKNASTVWDDTPCDQVTIENSSFYNFPRGIGSHTAVHGALHSNVTIKNNYFYNLSEAAIKLFNYKNTKVVGNYFGITPSGTKAPVGQAVYIYTWLNVSNFEREMYFKPNDSSKSVILPTNYQIEVKNNTIKNVSHVNSGFGNAIRVGGSPQKYISGITVSGNNINTTSNYGVFFTYATKSVVSENTIQNAAKDAINVNDKSTGITVSSNTISTPGMRAITYSNQARGSILNNKILSYSKKSAGAAILIYKTGGTSTKYPLIISGNAITGLGKTKNSHGIFVSGSKYISIKGNKLTKIDGQGICYYNSIYGVISGKNVIKNPTDGGINVTTNSTATIVDGNVIAGAKNSAISVYQSKKCKISNNQVSSSKNGINVNTKSDNIQILSNVITTAGTHGIWVSNCTNGMVKGNTIKLYAKSASAFHGIGIYQTKGTNAKTYFLVDSNKVYGTGKKTGRNGIMVSGGDRSGSSKFVKLSNNKIYNPDGAGIYLYNSTNNVIYKNVISKPTQNGIHVTVKCTKTNISNNKIYGSGKGSDKMGLFVCESNNVNVLGNLVSKVGGDGIVVYKSKGAKVNKNTVKAIKNENIHGIWLSQSEKSSVTNNTVSGAVKKVAILITSTKSYNEKGNKVK